jgi:hypothetical protein
MPCRRWSLLTPALYRVLRQQITEFHLRGWSCLSLKKLKDLAGE